MKPNMDRFSPYRNTELDITDDDISRREEIAADRADHERDCERDEEAEKEHP